MELAGRVGEVSLSWRMDDSDFQYRKLIVWQKAMRFSKVVYAPINQFPATEKYALSNQVRRAVVSIPSNIAEGCGRASNRDYADMSCFCA